MQFALRGRHATKTLWSTPNSNSTARQSNPVPLKYLRTRTCVEHDFVFFANGLHRRPFYQRYSVIFLVFAKPSDSWRTKAIGIDRKATALCLGGSITAATP